MEIIKADYQNKKHGREIVELLDAYAQDPMGGGEPLVQNTKDQLATELSKLPHAFSIIAYVDEKPAGLINCFEGFSTFSCKPLINVHDVVVLQEFRGKGLSQMMLKKVEEIAQEKGCCKITLEVLSNNETAKSAYLKAGFIDYQLDPKKGKALFWHKVL